MGKKSVFKETEKTVITEDGEILNERHEVEKISFNVEPEYIKVYLEDIARLKDLPTSVSKVMYCLIKRMSYNNLIPVHRPIKQAIAHELGISENEIKRKIQQLYDAGFLVRVSRGYYIADPMLFGKGYWKNIRELQLNVTYDEHGRKAIKASTRKDDNSGQLSLDFQE